MGGTGGDSEQDRTAAGKRTGMERSAFPVLPAEGPRVPVHDDNDFFPGLVQVVSTGMARPEKGDVKICHGRKKTVPLGRNGEAAPAVIASVLNGPDLDTGDSSGPGKAQRDSRTFAACQR